MGEKKYSIYLPDLVSSASMTYLFLYILLFTVCTHVGVGFSLVGHLSESHGFFLKLIDANIKHYLVWVGKLSNYIMHLLVLLPSKKKNGKKINQKKREVDFV